MTVVGGALASSLSSCDCHHFDEPDPGMSIGDILCTDGSVVSFSDYVTSGREAVAIVYHVNPDVDDEIRGYAVYLADISDEAFSDSIPVSQGTSRNLKSIDGNENTYALYKCDKTSSPMALPVFDLWTFGQSAYIPSVEQLRQIQSVKNFINPRIEAIGGDILPDAPDDCWYWSSTEVEGQEDIKAWLVSMHSGIIQETPKEQKHHCRPVVTVYRHNNQTAVIPDDELDKVKIPVTVNITIDKSMSDYIRVDSLDLNNARSSSNPVYRYCLAAYRGNEAEPYEVHYDYDPSFTLSLPLGKFNFVGWADPVYENNGRSYYFFTDDFSEILLRNKYDYMVNDPNKLAYRNKIEHRVSYTSKDISISLTPAMAKYRLIATDSPDYTPSKVVVSYLNIPSSIDGLSGKINGYWSDVFFNSNIIDDQIATDQVLAQDSEIKVYARIEIYDDKGVLKGRIKQLEIPLVKGGLTTIKGNFYTSLQQEVNTGEGGIIIDPDFEETVEIEY